MIRFLEDIEQIKESRIVLKKRKLSFCRNSIMNRLASKRYIPIEPRGHYMKSWDITCFLNVIESLDSQDKSFVDLGCYGSELPHILRELNIQKIFGVDIDAGIAKRSHGLGFCDKLFIGNMYDHELYKEMTFDIVTLVSVLEHGYDEGRFVSLIEKILSPGGYLIMSLDYNRKLINTEGVNLFGMTWTIFDEITLTSLIRKLEAIGVKLLKPQDADRICSKTNATPIQWAGKDYTFCFVAFKKD